MSDKKLVWSDDLGDLRKQKERDAVKKSDNGPQTLLLRRLTSGKGRTVIEIKGLPKDKTWCKALAKDIKKSLGVGGAYKNDYIEIHGEKLELVTNILDKKKIKWKKTGG